MNILQGGEWEMGSQQDVKEPERSEGKGGCLVLLAGKDGALGWKKENLQEAVGIRQIRRKEQKKGDSA